MQRTQRDSSMERNPKFMSLEEFDPEAAKHFPAGIRTWVSRRTLAEVAAERYRMIQIEMGVPSSDLHLGPLTAAQGEFLFAWAGRIRFHDPPD